MKTARLLVGDQVELAVAVAGLDVLEPMELLRRRAQRLRQQRPAGHGQRQLAAARLEGRAVDADQVAEVERHEAVEGLLAERVAARMELEAAGAVDQVEEGGAAMAAARGQPARHAVGSARLLARLETFVRLADRRDRHDPVEVVRERIDAL